MEQSKVNPLLGPALKSLYDIEVHLRKSTLEPELRELVKLRVSQINRCAYCIIYHRRDALNIGVAERKIHLAINAQPLEKVKLATLPDSYSSAQS
jgi:AhpD family alkylhydroperoxidase